MKQLKQLLCCRNTLAGTISNELKENRHKCVCVHWPDWEKIKVVSFTTDCAPSTAGQTAWFVTLFSKAIRYPVVPYHCTGGTLGK
jgi:hypothetical protein